MSILVTKLGSVSGTRELTAPLTACGISGLTLNEPLFVDALMTKLGSAPCTRTPTASPDSAWGIGELTLNEPTCVDALEELLSG